MIGVVVGGGVVTIDGRGVAVVIVLSSDDAIVTAAVDGVVVSVVYCCSDGVREIECFSNKARRRRRPVLCSLLLFCFLY